MRLRGVRLAALCTRIVSENFYSSARPPLVNWSSLERIKFDAKAQNQKKIGMSQAETSLERSLGYTRVLSKLRRVVNETEKPEIWL